MLINQVTCNLAKSDIDWLLWYRSQTFWNQEREDIIWEWLSYNHEHSIAAREYEEICKLPLCLPPTETEEVVKKTKSKKTSTS
jgi:hypothetical protein